MLCACYHVTMPNSHSTMSTTAKVISMRATLLFLSQGLGRHGALLVWKDGQKRLASPDVEKKSAVGAGSSFVAGLVFGLADGRSLEDAFALAVACGAAALMTSGTEMCRKADVDRLYAQLRG